MKTNDRDRAVVHYRFRNERIMQNNGQWYYLTRENTVEGPFGSKLMAQQSLESYIKFAGSEMFDEAALTRINSLTLAS